MSAFPLDPETVARHLCARVDGEVFPDRLLRSLYATDASIYRIVPACVVRPRSAEDVARVVAFCAEEAIPLAPRGGGTGLAGESLTSGVVIDLQPHLRGIGPVEDGEVWVDAGVVPDVLQRTLRPEGLLFGPDPATSDRCTVGGMVGINSTGGHSLVYGDTRRKVRALEVVLGDGTLATLRREEGLAADERVSGALGQLRELARAARRLPLPFSGGLRRNRHGYLLWEAAGDGFFDPTQVITGSEGTLAVVTRVRIALDPVPRSRALLVVQFADRGTPLRRVEELLDTGPASLEFLDDVLLGLARTMPAYAAAIPEAAGSWMMASYEGEPDEVRERLESARARFEGTPATVATEATLDESRQAFLHGLRRAAVPLLYRRSDGHLPLPFIEDAAVPPARLGEYVDDLERILGREGLEFTCYGHAGPGELHVRPFLRPSEAIDRLPAIAGEVFARAVALGGTASGEHGDGILRSFHIRRQYGDAMWELFRRAKRAMDPAGILNPGKKVTEETELPVRDLRYMPGTRAYGVGIPAETLSLRNGELPRAAFACTGCGSCRSEAPGRRMCPVFRHLGVEEASPRAKTNLLRELRSGGVGREEDLDRVLDLCLWCRSCGRECPSGLSIPEAIVELRGRQARAGRLSREKRWISMLPDLLSLGARFPRIVNVVQARKSIRALGQLLWGIDADRPAPELARRRLLRRPVRDVPRLEQGERGVVLFADLWADLFDPDLGRRAIAILEEAGCRVVLPAQEPCGVVPLVYGRVDAARRIAARNVTRLRPFVEAGYEVVTTEPTAALMLRKDYPLLLGEQSAVSEATHELGAFLHRRWREGAFSPRLLPDRAGSRLAYHRPCHLAELAEQGPGFPELLRDALGVELAPLPERCCGMSGTFGMRRRWRELATEACAPLVRALDEAGATGFVTECSSCSLHIGAESSREGLHPLELLEVADGSAGGRG